MIHVSLRALAHVAGCAHPERQAPTRRACDWGITHTHYIACAHGELVDADSSRPYVGVPTCPTCAVLWDMALEGQLALEALEMPASLIPPFDVWLRDLLGEPVPVSLRGIVINDDPPTADDPGAE